jgi:hypothetical protein
LTNSSWFGSVSAGWTWLCPAHVVQELHDLGRLVERLQRLELPQHDDAVALAPLGVVLERPHDPVPHLPVVGVVV